MTCSLCGEKCWPPCWRSWSGQLGRMQKSTVTLVSSTGLFLDWLDQPMLPYLDVKSVRLVDYVSNRSIIQGGD